VKPERLDRRLRALHPELSWTRIRNAIERGQVTVDGAIARDPAHSVAPSAVIDFNASRPALSTARLDLPRLYEDDEILVIDKPAGLLTIASDPESRATEDTVLRRAQEYARRRHGRNAYAGMLHRLDRGTSGALAIALSREAHRAGRALFAAHAFERWYLAVVDGVPRQDQGTIEANISDEYVSGRRRIVGDEDDGRHAVTHFRVRERFPLAALLELQLETGRQHQIRLHLQQLGHPIIGESVYVAAPGTSARVRRVTRPMLHAWRLRFPHPTERHTVEAEAPIPPDFERVLAELRKRGRRKGVGSNA
jgi:23S rRNA pseudouridine1911/1915/1917 synthase